MEMRDPIQLLILKAMTVHLEGLVVSQDGTELSMVGRVFRGKTVFGSEEPVPFLSILEGKMPDKDLPEVGEDGLRRQEDWGLLLQGYYDDNPDTPLDNLYRLKAAVEQRLAQVVEVTTENGLPAYPDVFNFGGLIDGMEIGPGIVRGSTPAAGGTEAFYLPVTVKFAMNVADPYSVT